MTLTPTWKYILKLFTITRVITFIAAVIAYYYLPFKWSFPYWDTVLQPYGHNLFWSWANFDGVHYIMLAGEGYNFGLTQAFFPLYMLLIKFISFIIPNKLLVALIISHTFYILSLYMFYRLIRLDFSAKIAQRALLLYAIFPTSFFFLSVYTESMFMFLLFTVFYLFRKNRWLCAGLVGIALTATRIVGVFIIPALIYESLQIMGLHKFKIQLKITTNKQNLSKLLTNRAQHLINNRFIFYSILPIFGLLAYMLFLQIKFNDPLMFAHVQEGFGAGRQTGKFILPYQVIWRYFKMIVTVDKHNPLYFTIWLEFLSSVSFFALLIYAWIKKIRPSYIIFSILAILLPTLTGTFSSMPRYVIVAFPVFILLGQIKNDKLYRLIVISFAALLVIGTAMFTRGYWIS